MSQSIDLTKSTGLIGRCQYNPLPTVRDLAVHSPGLAERLAAGLARKRMKPTDLATAAGVSKQTVSNVIASQRVTRAVGRRFAEILGVELAELAPELGGAVARPAVAKGHPRVQYDGAGSMPRELKAMGLRFLAEAHEAGADDGFLRYAKHALEDPELAALYAGGLDDDGRPMTAEEQREDYEAVIEGLRLIMKRRMQRATTKR